MAGWKGCGEVPLELVGWFPCCVGGCQASALCLSTQPSWAFARAFSVTTGRGNVILPTHISWGLLEGFGQGRQRGRAAAPCPQCVPKHQPRILSSCQAARAGTALCPTPALLAAARQEQAAGRDAGIPLMWLGGHSHQQPQSRGQGRPSDGLRSTDTCHVHVQHTHRLMGQDNHHCGGGSWGMSQASA